MTADDRPVGPIEHQLEAVSHAIGRAAADLESARIVLDRERADFIASGAKPSRALVIAATRLVDEMRRTDEALTDLLKQLDRRDARE